MNELSGDSRFRIRIRWALVISALLLPHAPIIALDAPATAREHTILVSVLNNAGHPVRQPRTDDFQVTENKRTVEISRLQSASPRPILFTLLIDTSKWAHHEKARDAIEGALDFFTRIMRKNDRLVIASFSDQFHLGSPTQDPTQAHKEMNNLTWGTRAEFYDAIVQLASTLPVQTESERHIVILLTDGNDSSSKASLKDAIESVQANDIVIFAIDTRFVHRKRAGQAEERKLAEESGGQCFEFVSNKELENALKDVQAAVENQYFLTYVSIPEAHAKIRVKARDLLLLAPEHS